MIKEQWKRIGIQADVKEMERSLFFRRVAGNEHQIALWANDGSEVLYLFPRHALPLDPVEALLGTPGQAAPLLGQRVRVNIGTHGGP